MMLLPGTISPTIWLIFTVLIMFIVLGETVENNRLDIKFGFDLKHGSNGVPSLRIREFEGPVDVNRRSRDHSNESRKRARSKDDSSSVSDSDEANKKGSNEKHGKGQKSDDSDSGGGSEDVNDSSDDDNLRVTKGLKPDDFEAEENSKENPKFHGHKMQDAESSDGFIPFLTISFKQFILALFFMACLASSGVSVPAKLRLIPN